MNSILAIAVITIRNAIRSKIVIVLLLFLLLTLIGFPLTIKGDGTLSGEVRLLLRYTLGLATLILSIATVWTSCAAISSEIRYRHIQMVLSKPVRASQIWLGKWIGLTAMNAILLSICVISTYGALRWTTQQEKLTEEEIEELRTEILAAHVPVKPRTVDLDREIIRQYHASRVRGDLPDNMPSHEILSAIERDLRARAYSVPAGSSNRWIFDLPHLPPPDRPLVLQYRFSSSVMDMGPVRGVWTAWHPESPRRHSETVEVTPRTLHSITLPSDLASEEGTLTIEFENTSERRTTILFNPDDGLRLMVYKGDFTVNYLKASLLIFIHLAFLGAIGTTAGAFFSIPVAALTSFYALVLLHAGRVIGGIVEGDMALEHSDAGWAGHALASATRMIHEGLNVVVQPVYAANPLSIVAAGEWIGWGEVGYMFTVKIVAYSGVLMALSIWHLSRKEVALPS